MYLGLDLGTSGLRALLIDANGRPIGSAEKSYGVSHPHAGWSEQNPSDWVAALEHCMTALRDAYPRELSRVEGIGTSGQMHGATLLDDSDAVLRPCILWNDTRSHEEAAMLDVTDDVRQLSGNIVFPGFTAPKLVWVARHEPEIFARIAKVLLPKDYLNFWMTGEHVSDMSDAAGTTWLDVKKRDWSPDLLSASNMRRDQMPRLIEGSQVAGRLRAELAASWGIGGTPVVVGGGGDNAAAACGVGALAEGQGFVSLGTSGVLLAAKDSFAPMPETAVHSFCHAVPGRWYQMGVILSATDSLNWLARNLNAKPAALAAQLPEQLDAPAGLQFLPYLSGERTPHNDSAVRGAFIGLDIDHSPADLTRAVMQGVSYALRDCAEALKRTGTEFGTLLAIGGGAQSRYWTEMLATVLGVPLTIPAQGDFGAALGAARLAICGATGDSPEAIMTTPPVSETIHPRAALRDAYEAAYTRYRAVYPAIKALQ